MPKKKIFIAIIALAAIGAATIILVFSRFPVSPGVSEKTGGRTEPISGTEALGGAPAAEEAPVAGIAGPGAQEVEGINYRIVYKTDIEGQATVYDVLTGKISRQKVDLLVKKIAADLTGTNPALKTFSLNFYSSQSLIDEQEVDVAAISWTADKTSVKMIGK